MVTLDGRHPRDPTRTTSAMKPKPQPPLTYDFLSHLFSLSSHLTPHEASPPPQHLYHPSSFSHLHHHSTAQTLLSLSRLHHQADGSEKNKKKNMQEAISYKSWPPPILDGGSLKAGPLLLGIGDRTNQSNSNSNSDGKEDRGVREVVSENALIVVGRRGCCMGHVVKRLLLGLGVNPAVYEVDEEDEKGVANELERIAGGGGGGEVQFPAVFIGGRLFGGLDRVMATHISGELVPILRQAGALWL